MFSVDVILERDEEGGYVAKCSASLDAYPKVKQKTKHWKTSLTLLNCGLRPNRTELSRNGH